MSQTQRVRMNLRPGSLSRSSLLHLSSSGSFDPWPAIGLRTTASLKWAITAGMANAPPSRSYRLGSAISNLQKRSIALRDLLRARHASGFGQWIGVARAGIEPATPPQVAGVGRRVAELVEQVALATRRRWVREPFQLRIRDLRRYRRRGTSSGRPLAPSSSRYGALLARLRGSSGLNERPVDQVAPESAERVHGRGLSPG